MFFASVRVILGPVTVRVLAPPAGVAQCSAPTPTRNVAPTDKKDRSMVITLSMIATTENAGFVKY